MVHRLNMKPYNLCCCPDLNLDRYVSVLLIINYCLLRFSFLTLSLLLFYFLSLEDLTYVYFCYEHVTQASPDLLNIAIACCVNTYDDKLAFSRMDIVHHDG